MGEAVTFIKIKKTAMREKILQMKEEILEIMFPTRQNKMNITMDTSENYTGNQAKCYPPRTQNLGIKTENIKKYQE